MNGKGGIAHMEGEGNTRITQSWIPKYPGGNKLAAMKATTNGKESGTYQFQTSDAVSKVLEFYESGFQAEGFEVNRPLSPARIPTAAVSAPRRIRKQEQSPLAGQGTKRLL